VVEALFGAMPGILTTLAILSIGAVFSTEVFPGRNPYCSTRCWFAGRWMNSHDAIPPTAAATNDSQTSCEAEETTPGALPTS